MGKETKVQLDEPIYDAKTLGTPKMLVLGLQHLFAMFGATVLVPILTGLSVSATLLFAGLATLFMHLVTKKKVPVFLGSSFAFLGGYFAVVASGAELGLSQSESLPYACVGVACAGLLYLVLALICKACGSKNVMRFFPPVVTGPIIIAIGLILAPSAINNCSTNWPIALAAIVVVIVCNIWGKGMIKRLQYLGQGHDQDRPHPHGCSGLLPDRRPHRQRGLLRREGSRLDRPARQSGEHRVQPLRR